VADFTYLWTSEGWLFVAAVLDLFSRRVVGWSMHPAMTTQLVTDALTMAIWRRGSVDALLHHSDRGSQYTSESFQRLLRELGVTCSMSRSGNVWDNSVMESFFSTLKTERTNRKYYNTRDAARADVFDYIERFYNPLRRHSTLGYRSPVAFEALHNLGGMQLPVVVVLNDNGMSIAPNVGALSRYFNRSRLNPRFYKAREGFEGTVVLHCFSAPELLPVALERGYYVSFAGNVTYPSAEELREAVRLVPSDRLLVETDSPYLSPQPRRGRPNEPANVVHTVAALAEARGEDADQLANRLDANATAAFTLA